MVVAKASTNHHRPVNNVQTSSAATDRKARPTRAARSSEALQERIGILTQKFKRCPPRLVFNSLLGSALRPPAKSPVGSPETGGDRIPTNLPRRPRPLTPETKRAADRKPPIKFVHRMSNQKTGQEIDTDVADAGSRTRNSALLPVTVALLLTVIFATARHTGRDHLIDQRSDRDSSPGRFNWTTGAGDWKPDHSRESQNSSIRAGADWNIGCERH